MKNLYNEDCMVTFNRMIDNSVDYVLTDIPYGEVSRPSNGLRVLDKSFADVTTFNIGDFLTEIYRITKNGCTIFCGNEQYSEIYTFFNRKSKSKSGGTVRQIIWAKSNPSPMNGQHIYLSGTENAVWFKKRGGTFNAHCKKNVFMFPCGRSKLHPTEKNHKLITELIEDSTNIGDTVYDPCMGSGTTAVICETLGRKWIGSELSKEYYDITINRMANLSI